MVQMLSYFGKILPVKLLMQGLLVSYVNLQVIDVFKETSAALGRMNKLYIWFLCHFSDICKYLPQVIVRPPCIEVLHLHYKKQVKGLLKYCAQWALRCKKN